MGLDQAIAAAHSGAVRIREGVGPHTHLSGKLEEPAKIMREAVKVRKNVTDFLTQGLLSRVALDALGHGLQVHNLSVLVHILDVDEEGGPGAVSGGVHVCSVCALSVNSGHLQLLLTPESLQVHAHAIHEGSTSARAVQVSNAVVATLGTIVPVILTAGTRIPHGGGVHNTFLVESSSDITSALRDLPGKFRHRLIVQKSVDKGANSRNSFEDTSG
mmetsp:Transcript_91708/g.179695  ORF Transcript_91708/g.179695 Transcript_91708/m.179695 type:complete len:216 (-) Transcript_91708:139-786(-)